jgi:hypothetical protein
MTDTKFTPGPWVSQPHNDYDKDIYVLGGDTFIRVDNDDVEHDEATANAHLIAAAPDLYEALSSVGDNLLSGDDSAHGGYVDLDGAAVQKIMDALAKARGEAS